MPKIPESRRRLLPPARLGLSGDHPDALGRAPPSATSPNGSRKGTKPTSATTRRATTFVDGALALDRAGKFLAVQISSFGNLGAFVSFLLERYRRWSTVCGV